MFYPPLYRFIKQQDYPQRDKQDADVIDKKQFLVKDKIGEDRDKYKADRRQGEGDAELKPG